MAGRICELRSAASRALAAETDAVAAPARRVLSGANVEDAVEDLAPAAAKVRASAETVLRCASGVPPRLEALKALVGAVQGNARRKRPRPLDETNPADVVVAHLAQPETLADFLSPPRPLGREPRTVGLLEKQIII